MEIMSLGIMPSKKLYPTNNYFTHVKSLCVQIKALILIVSIAGRISASTFLSLSLLFIVEDGKENTRSSLCPAIKENTY